jgi:hypothetical protein
MKNNNKMKDLLSSIIYGFLSGIELMSNNKMNIFSFFIGLSVGIIVVSIMLTYLPNSSYSIVTNAITECESNIPRNQHCKIIAVINEE